MTCELDFLRLVSGDGWHSLCSDRGSKFHTIDHYDDAEKLFDAAITENADGGNIWFGVHPMPDRPADGRGTADDVDKVNVIIADLDWDDPYGHKANPGDLPTEAEVRQRLARFEHPPSAVVNSGHGLQAYWMLFSPVDAADGRDLILRMHTALQKAGMPADRSDLASVLRIPGTISRKPGCDEVEVTVEKLDENVVYQPQFLAKRLPKAERRHKATIANTEATDPVPVHWWTDGPIGAGDRHESLIAAAGWCRHNGIPRNDAIPTIRDVWQRHDPAQYTWDEALERLDDVYGRYPDDKAAGTFSVNATTGEIVEIPKYFSDAEVGEAFGTLLVGRYLHCRALGGWLRWDGRRWRRDESESVFEEARQYVLDLGKRLFDTDADSKTIAAAARYRDRSKLDAIVTIARRLDGIAATSSDFDQHPDLLVAGNGVVDLRTGELVPHDPTLRITQCTTVDYQPDTKHADVDTVLRVVDDDVRRWMQKLLGYAATGHVSEDVMPVLDGTGSNGKTTLLGAAGAALGDYAHAVPPRLLMKTAHDEHPSLFADLRARRLAYIEETAEGGSLRVETMKSLTGGGKIPARYMRMDWFEFEPTHTLFLATNHRPAVNSTEHATWRRLRLVPFPHRYAPTEQLRDGDRLIDPKLRSRLTTGKAQREAMLSWIVAGAVAWHRDGLGDSEAVTAATNAWRRSEDVMVRFAHDRLSFDSSAQIGSQEMYDEYRRWCDTEGRPPMSNKALTMKLREHDLAAEHGLDNRRTMIGSRWFGVRIRSIHDDHDGYSDERSRGRVEKLTEVPSSPSYPGDSATEHPTLTTDDPPTCDLCDSLLDGIGCCTDSTCPRSAF